MGQGVTQHAHTGAGFPVTPDSPTRHVEAIQRAQDWGREKPARGHKTRGGNAESPGLGQGETSTGPRDAWKQWRGQRTGRWQVETSTGEAVSADGIEGSRVTCKCCPCGVPTSRTATKGDAVGGWGPQVNTASFLLLVWRHWPKTASILPHNIVRRPGQMFEFELALALSLSAF